MSSQCYPYTVWRLDSYPVWQCKWTSVTVTAWQSLIRRHVGPVLPVRGGDHLRLWRGRPHLQMFPGDQGGRGRGRGRQEFRGSPGGHGAGGPGGDQGAAGGGPRQDGQEVRWPDKCISKHQQGVPLLQEPNANTPPPSPKPFKVPFSQLLLFHLLTTLFQTISPAFHPYQNFKSNFLLVLNFEAQEFVGKNAEIMTNFKVQ